MRVVLASLALAGIVGSARAAEPTPAVTGLTAFPPALTIRGADDAPQLLVTGLAANNRQLDLTASTTFVVSNPSVARIDRDGRVYPLANGACDITATAAGRSVKVPV